MRFAGLALILLAAAPAAAQDRVRLDEFALPAGADAIVVEQLPASDPLHVQQAIDRSLAVPQHTATPHEPVTQLAAPGEAAPPNQLTSRANSRRLAPAAVSAAADSRPAPAAPIGGSDRCDPQAGQGAETAECLHILELRAAEFQAAEAPRLSAEQALLAEQQHEEDRLSPSDALRLRLASSKDPNADLRTNQEIAAVYLGRDRDVGSPPPEEGAAETEIPGDVIEAIQAVILGTPQP